MRRKRTSCADRLVIRTRGFIDFLSGLHAFDFLAGEIINCYIPRRSRHLSLECVLPSLVNDRVFKNFFSQTENF